MKNKQQLIDILENAIVNPNNCKYLHGGKKKRYWIHIRDRQPENTYYSVVLKGNYIRGYKMQYIVDGKAINAFLDITVATLLGEKPAKVEYKKELFVKERLQDYEVFIKKFRENSPSLEWDDE